MNIEYEDLLESRQRRENRFVKGAVRFLTVVGTPIAFIMLAAFFLYASQPDLKAKDIISMHGYGEKPQLSTMPRKRQRTLQEIPARATGPETPDYETALYESTTAQPQEEVMRVNTQWSIVRSAPRRNSAIVSSLPAGKTVTVLSRDDKWLRVQLQDGGDLIGYMHRSLLTDL